jgi:perosamine synthetase
MEFLVAKEPSLSWRMFYPGAWRRDPLPSSNGKPAYSLFWARSAIYHGLRALALTPGDNVLVPAYHCAAAVEPILRSGAKVKFYNIHRDCSPDIVDIRAKIDERTRALLTIHYFGFSQPIRGLQGLCRTHHLYLIEDCAHVLSGEVDGARLGTFGDISVFSWRKFFPLYDGGQLVLNNLQLSVDIHWQPNTFLYQLKVVKNVYDKLSDGAQKGVLKDISRMVQFSFAAGRRLFKVNEQKRKILELDTHSLSFDLASTNVRMSKFSRYILQNTDLSVVTEKRRLNYTRLLEEIKGLPEIAPIFPDLPPTICPWVLPVVCQQQDFHTRLRAKGIPATTWGGVIHPSLPLEKFPEAAFLYQNLFFLPVHQSLEDSDIQLMAEIITDTLRSEN